MQNLELLKYPIGKVVYPDIITKKQISEWIQTIEEFPVLIENEVKELSKSQINYKYRPEGWSILQIINHCADSHMNSVIRFKLALTEKNPTIRPYNEAQWAELNDTVNYNIYDTLILLKTLHKRWVFLLKTMSTEDFKLTFIHPEGDKIVTLEENLCIYNWHCKHHLQHIKNAKELQYS